MFKYGKLNKDGNLIRSVTKDPDSYCLTIFEKNKKDEYYSYYKLEKINGKYAPDIDKIEEKEIELENTFEELKNKQKVSFNQQYPLGLTESIKDNIKDYVCPKCRNYEIPLDRIFGSHILKDMYCVRNNIPCTQCKKNSTLFEQNKMLNMLMDVVKYNAFNEVYKTLGSQTNIGVVDIKKDQINTIYFEEMGVPDTAKVLDINLTSMGDFSPLKMMPNNPRHICQDIDKSFSFFPVKIFPLPQDSVSKDTLSIQVQWFDSSSQDMSDINLLQAMDNYIDNKPLELIMNANRTLELLCNQICFKEFNKEKGKKSVNDFLVTGATYGHQLNHLLNLICKTNNLEKIDSDLLGKINALRRQRNDIAHRGQLEDGRELTKKEKEELLSVAILGSSLMKYILINM